MLIIRTSPRPATSRTVPPPGRSGYDIEQMLTAQALIKFQHNRDRFPCYDLGEADAKSVISASLFSSRGMSSGFIAPHSISWRASWWWP